MFNRVRQKLVVLCAVGACAGGARADNFYWGVDGLSLSPGIYSSMFLRDDNVAAVDQFLAGQSVRVIKIAQGVSPATVAAIYNKYKVDYTFADFEGPDSLALTTNLVNSIKASAGTGAAFTANHAFVSNFGFAPIYNDPTATGPAAGISEYAASGVNMASENLYPGSPTFRSPASGNSTVPNIRSALFTLPVERFSFAASSMPAGHAHVAYVDRFNNWQNNALDTDGDPSNGYKFVTKDQLLSRGDFSALVLHYRLRGAAGVHALEGGVEGYTPAQAKADINQGWNGVPAVQQVLADPKARMATLDTIVKADGASRSLEDVGVVFSGAYSTAQGKFVAFLSNLDEGPHTVTFPSNIGGKVVSGDYTIAAGSHEIIEFVAAGSKWNFVAASDVFVDADRAGVGIPEPSTFALMAAAALLGCTRSRKRK